MFFIWTHGEKRLQTFLEKLDKIHPNITSTHASRKENISFLDPNIIYDLHIKPTDRHQYLHYSSSHIEHTKQSIVFSQGLRVRRTCPCENDFRKKNVEMKL